MYIWPINYHLNIICMKKVLAFGLLVLLFVVSCKKDDSNESVGMQGTYTEVSPVAGRTQVIFSSSAGISIVQKNLKEDYTYEIVGNQIRLMLNGSNTVVSTLYFESLSSSQFKIENIYPSIPETPVTYITFEKK